QIFNAIDLAIKPARHLHTRVATRKRDQIEGRIDFTPQLKSAAMMQPAVHLLRGHTKRDSGKKLRGRRLASPVIRAAVAHLYTAIRDRIEHPHGRDNFISAIYVNLQASIAHLFYIL